MDTIECRKRAGSCRQQAARTWGALKLDFLKVAEQWDALAEEHDHAADPWIRPRNPAARNDPQQP
jgi:hypothetical protein